MNNASQTDRIAATAEGLRSSAAFYGLTGVIVRKGVGCRRGAVHFFMRTGATREERSAAASFLEARKAIVVFGGAVDVSLRLDVLGGGSFDSATVLSLAT